VRERESVCVCERERERESTQVCMIHMEKKKGRRALSLIEM